MEPGVWERTPGIIGRRIAGETILVPTQRRAREMALFTLNEVGTFVWERLDGAANLETLAEAVVDAFEVERSRALADLGVFLDALRAAGCAGPARAGETS